MYQAGSETALDRTLRALVVEDSRDDALLIRETLERDGYKVEDRVIATAVEFREALLGERWDIIICDHRLPSFDSFAALRIRDEVKLDIPLIIVSGVIGEEIAVRAMREGAQDYVLKSNLARLPAAIERERREARSRARRHSAEAERERLLRVAQTANRMKDEFLATLSHELRTPLSVILGHLEFLQEEEGLSDSARDSIQTICRNAQLQLQLVNDLMDVSRIITGQLRLETTLIDTEKAMDESLKSLQLMSDAKRISITKTYASHGTLVRGDSARLQQVFWNLLSNAIKFTAAGGKIFVRIENENSFVKIEVQDTGVGIEPKFLPHVFDRFRQEDSSTTRAYGGLGLGLAIVRHIVELHGGTITAESAGKNQGALFRVCFPVSAPGQG